MLGLKRRFRERFATPEAEAPTQIVDDFPGSDEALRAEIATLSQDNRVAPDRQRERTLLRLRHIAGLRLLDQGGNGSAPRHPEPDRPALPAGPLPELAPDQLTPELIRAGILRDGCVLVRGLVPRERALDFAADIERCFDERERLLEGSEAAEGYYEEVSPAAGHEFEPGSHDWIRACGGVLAADSPLLMARMLDLFEGADLPRLVGDYLGERPLLSFQKTTLRKADPKVAGAWHQDGAFMGDVRALNLWLSLSRCGDEAPGLDIVPRRLDGIVTTHTEEAKLSWQVSGERAAEAAGDAGITRPIFEPGDALIFDELFLHQTASDPAMPKPRYAIESWFFGGSSFPAGYGPVAV